MRFRFCWDCDCPDWLLAEMIVLSKINSENLKKLTQSVSQSICGDHLNYEDVVNISSTELKSEEIQASIAAIRWILESAAGSDTDPQVLDSELQQLGLPREQSSSIKEIYLNEKDNLRKALKDQSLKASGKVTWNYEIKGINLGESQERIVKLNLGGQIYDQGSFHLSSTNPETPLKVDDKQKSESDGKMELYLLPDQLYGLLHELQRAHTDMKELEQS